MTLFEVKSASLKHFTSLNYFNAKMYFFTYKTIQKSDAKSFKMHLMFCTLKRSAYKSEIQIKSKNYITVTFRLFTHIVFTEKKYVKIQEIVKIREVTNILSIKAVF